MTGTSTGTMMHEEHVERHGVPSDWYASAFGPLYAMLYAHRDVKAAEMESSFAAAQVELKLTDAALDLCCGNGRHLVHLTKRTKHAVGVDYSLNMLQMARREVGGKAGLVRADMRALPFAEAFDVVFNFFTSFGYFLSDGENRLAAQCMARALRPGGRFFMDYLNPPQVERSLVPHSEREQNGFVIVEDRWIDWEARRINKQTLVRQGDTAAEKTIESVRLYTREELGGLLRGAGLEIDQAFGDYSGKPLDDTQPRMILVGHRTR